MKISLLKCLFEAVDSIYLSFFRRMSSNQTVGAVGIPSFMSKVGLTTINPELEVDGKLFAYPSVFYTQCIVSPLYYRCFFIFHIL